VARPLHMLCVAGARPNFVKLASLVAAAKQRGDVVTTVVHTGQHYSAALSDELFRDLALPEPDVNLEVGSASHAVQLARLMERFEPTLAERRPAVVVVVGDVNSTVACALVASRARVPTAHVEAGLRSGDRGMPEEVNRVMTDAIADLLFVSEPSGMRNLAAEGVPAERCFLVGNTMVDTLLVHLERARTVDVARRLGLGDEPYGVVTLHRPGNVDSRDVLAPILDGLAAVAAALRLVFPVHPRTRERLERFGLLEALTAGGRVALTEPLGYLDFLALNAGAKLILTDSGGIQEEAVVLEVPCLTLRPSTERPATIEAGVNRLVDGTAEAIVTAARDATRGAKLRVRRPEYWDGRAGERILRLLVERLPVLGLR